MSLRVEGAIDPDAVDLEIKLVDGTRTVAIHSQTNWLLRILPEGPSCDYLVALLVLLDEEGGLLAPERFSEVTGANMFVEVSVRSPTGNASGRFPVQLLPPVEE